MFFSCDSEFGTENLGKLSGGDEENHGFFVGFCRKITMEHTSMTGALVHVDGEDGVEKWNMSKQVSVCKKIF